MRERLAFRLAVLRVFPYGGKLLVPAAILQLLSGLTPVAFIVATSVVVGRVPGAVEHGLDSPEWRSLRNALLVAGALFVAAAGAQPPAVHARDLARMARSTTGSASAPQSRRSAPSASAALEEPKTFDTLADLVDTQRGTGFTPGWACWATLLLLAAYVQWAVAARADRRRLRLVGGDRARGRRTRPARHDPHRLRPAQPLRGDVRAGSAGGATTSAI